jgi:hypothetical protein
VETRIGQPNGTSCSRQDTQNRESIKLNIFNDKISLQSDKKWRAPVFSLVLNIPVSGIEYIQKIVPQFSSVLTEDGYFLSTC